MWEAVGRNQFAYEAWVKKNGKPKDYASQLKQNPELVVSHYLKYMGNVRGKRVAN